jgi:uncharacterized protein (TIGR02598 family)
MKPAFHSQEHRHHGRGGFTLVEVAIAVGVLSVMIVALYLAFSQGFTIIQVARENLRATQILQEKTETIRLYTWDQINTAGFIPATFESPFYPVGTSTNQGLIYEGRVTIAPCPITESYATDLRQVDVTLTWNSGQLTRSRSMTTFVSRYGLHNYIY